MSWQACEHRQKPVNLQRQQAITIAAVTKVSTREENSQGLFLGSLYLIPTKAIIIDIFEENSLSRIRILYPAKQ